MRKPIAVIIRKINMWLNDNNAIFTVFITHDEFGAKFYFKPINDWGLDINNGMTLFNIPIMDYVYDMIEQKFNEEDYSVSWNNTRNIFWVR